MTNIMVIDINATTVYRIRKLLEGIPVEVITASTSYEAINRVGNLQSILDMIIIDVNLGSEDGYELISKLKEINPNLVVIIATSINTRKSFIRAIRVGANDYILKPFDDEYVKSKLMAHIKFIETSKTLPTSSPKQI
ncbi:MAG TPA: response regulator [Fusibacter sp.]|nr:response regulator [Fusibacter sp.]